MKSKLGSWVGYHYLIDTDGELYQTRLPSEEGAHCKEQGMNTKSLGVCVCMDGDVEMPTSKQETTLKELLAKLLAVHGMTKDRIRFHREFAINKATGEPYKSCPGNKVTKNYVYSLLLSKSDMIKDILEKQKKDKEGKYIIQETFDKPGVTKFWAVNVNNKDRKYIGKKIKDIKEGWKIWADYKFRTLPTELLKEYKEKEA